jgi:multiple antibiotic resistance protein
MMSLIHHPFVHFLFIGIIALFPVVNPIGSAFIINPYLSHLSSIEKRRAVKKITFYAFCICTISLFAGHWILEIFGISIPVIQLAGGIMICKMGWEFLSSDKEPDQSTKDAADQAITSGYEDVENKLFYPITFPITAGAGTISVLFTLSAHSSDTDMAVYLMNTSAIMLAIIIICVLIYIFYFNTRTIINYLGSNGERIVNRITAFLIFCVGLQIAVTGIRSLVKGS